MQPYLNPRWAYISEGTFRALRPHYFKLDMRYSVRLVLLHTQIPDINSFYNESIILFRT